MPRLTIRHIPEDVAPCPKCSAALRKDQDGTVCIICGWRPARPATDQDHADAVRRSRQHAQFVHNTIPAQARAAAATASTHQLELL